VAKERMRTQLLTISCSYNKAAFDLWEQSYWWSYFIKALYECFFIVVTEVFFLTGSAVETIDGRVNVFCCNATICLLLQSL